jgi:hypothetical protein
MQTVSFSNTPIDTPVLYVNSKIYLPNEMAGVTWSVGNNFISWDETITEYVLDANDEIIVSYDVPPPTP